MLVALLHEASPYRSRTQPPHGRGPMNNAAGAPAGRPRLAQRGRRDGALAARSARPAKRPAARPGPPPPRHRAHLGLRSPHGVGEGTRRGKATQRTEAGVSPPRRAAPPWQRGRRRCGAAPRCSRRRRGRGAERGGR